MPDFRGLVLEMTINPSVNATIVVKDRSGFTGWLSGYVGVSLEGLPRVSFDHGKFADKFAVYSSNEAEAHRLITPRLMEMALELGRKQSIEFAMMPERIFLFKMQWSRDLFEPASAERSALTTEDSRKFLEELHGVLQIVKTVAQATGSSSAPDYG